MSHALGGGCLPDRVFGPLGMTGQLVRELRGALAAAQGGLHHGQRVAQVAYRASGFVEVPGAEECKKGEGRACTQARPQLEAPVARCRRALVVVNCARTRPRARSRGRPWRNISPTPDIRLPSRTVDCAGCAPCTALVLTLGSGPAGQALAKACPASPQRKSSRARSLTPLAGRAWLADDMTGAGLDACDEMLAAWRYPAWPSRLEAAASAKLARGSSMVLPPDGSHYLSRRLSATRPGAARYPARDPAALPARQMSPPAR